MTYTILIWAFPLYLVIVEIGFRTISGVDTTNFIGPAIATAGLSFMLPLTKPKDVRQSVNQDIIDMVNNNGGTIVSKNDLIVIPIFWLLILFGFLIWLGSCYYAIKEPNSVFFVFPKHVEIGAINYIIAAICSSVKQLI